jgi:hypothetical protein
VTPETAFEFLSQRRSARNYKELTPPAEWLKKIVEIAGFAPGSPHHRIGWVREITIMTGDGNMRIIRDMTAEYIKKTIRLLDSWYLKAMAIFSELAKAGVAAVPDLQMRFNNLQCSCCNIFPCTKILFSASGGLRYRIAIRAAICRGVWFGHMLERFDPGGGIR